MIPKVVDSFESQAGFHFYLFDTGVMTTSFSIRHLDQEKIAAYALEAQLGGILENLGCDIRAKFQSSTERSFDALEGESFRSKSAADLGWTDHSMTVTFEKDVPGFRRLLQGVIKSKFKKSILESHHADLIQGANIQGLEALGFIMSPIKCNIIFEDKYVKTVDSGLRIEDSLVSVIKLSKLGNYENNIEALAFLREGLPQPYDIVTTVSRLDEKASQLKLNNKSKREESGRDLKSLRKYQEAQAALEEVDNQGKKVFSVELTILLWAPPEMSLISRTHQARDLLKSLGDFTVEDLGAFSGFAATLPGGRSHITNVELTNRIPTFLPLLVRGLESIDQRSPREFLFHRSDDSLDQFDLFAPEQSNFSAIVIGRSGRGKSVLTNTLTQCLMNDPNLRVILVDVKGSHTNTVRNLGGQIHEINSATTSSMSPFNYLRGNKSMEMVEILSDFIEKMLLEDGEHSLRREEMAKVEECLVSYVESNPSEPSIDDFLKKSPKLPRISSMKRWVKGGIYGKLFSSHKQSTTDSRITYFDFTNIITAQKGGVGSCVMSAVMAHFNHELLSLKTNERLVFIADETPFFVRSCFSSFSLLMKNLRKLNGSLVLVAQNLSDLVVDGDPSLISQTETRIYFSKDENEEKFDSLSGLNATSSAILGSLGTFNGRYAQFIISNKAGERMGKLRLSREEYLRSTTLATDRDKIEKFSELFGIKDENIAIEALADLGGKYALIF